MSVLAALPIRSCFMSLNEIHVLLLLALNGVYVDEEGGGGEETSAASRKFGSFLKTRVCNEY